jgi:hypothetical protein
MLGIWTGNFQLEICLQLVPQNPELSMKLNQNCPICAARTGKAKGGVSYWTGFETDAQSKQGARGLRAIFVASLALFCNICPHDITDR